MATSEISTKNQLPFWPIVQWLILGSISVLLLSLIAAQLPARFKLLGLFSLAFGLLTGAGLAKLICYFKIRIHWLTVSLNSCLILAGLGNLSYQTYSAQLQHFKALPQDPLQSLAIQQFIEQAETTDDPETQKELERLKQSLQKEASQEREQLSFLAYLQRRLSNLSQWSVWGASTFWILELILATFLGSFVFYKICRKNDRQSPADLQPSS